MMSYETLGNYSQRVPSGALPTDVEQDTPPLGQYTPALNPPGNFVSLHRANISSNYTPRHPLITGRSTFTSPPGASSFQNSQSEDIAPEIHPYEGYKLESKRLETFHDWPPTAVVTKEDLARNGFISLHVADRAQCVFCRGVLSNWEAGDIVADEHKRHCPECPFAFGYECGNIPLNQVVTSQRTYHPQRVVSLSSPVPQQQSQVYNTTVKIPVQPQNVSQHRVHVVPPPPFDKDVNICGGSVTLGGGSGSSGNFVYQNAADARGISDNTFTSLPSLPSGPQSIMAGQPAASTNEPKYKAWEEEGTRLRSFVGWPSQMTQKPLDLARAGLLYMGSGDRCKCFWCGGELYDWEPEDVPWEEHAKWFSHCNYVRRCKGDQYIQYVKDKQNGLIVESPSVDLLGNPHVLAVLQNGYTQEQVLEVFNRFGAGRFVDARTIVQAIEQTRSERQAMQNQGNAFNFGMSGNSSNYGSTENVNLSDNDINMEDDEEPESSGQPTSNQNNRKDSVKDNATSGSLPNSAASGSESKKDVDSVLLENEKLKDQKLCKICLDSELSMTFLPCGHLATCEECSKALNECPICRKLITQKVKIFWS